MRKTRIRLDRAARRSGQPIPAVARGVDPDADTVGRPIFGIHPGESRDPSTPDPIQAAYALLRDEGPEPRGEPPAVICTRGSHAGVIADYYALLREVGVVSPRITPWLVNGMAIRINPEIAGVIRPLPGFREHARAMAAGWVRSFDAIIEMHAHLHDGVNAYVALPKGDPRDVPVLEEIGDTLSVMLTMLDVTVSIAAALSACLDDRRATAVALLRDHLLARLEDCEIIRTGPPALDPQPAARAWADLCQRTAPDGQAPWWLRYDR